MGKLIKASEILSMLENQQYRCALTGRTLRPETASLDHIQPLSKGGAHDISNIWIVDHQVNSAKGSLTAEEFIKLCQDVMNNESMWSDWFLRQK